MEADEVLDIYEDNQYFCKDIISFDQNSVFIDVGAYLGDSLKPFLENTQNYCFKKAICFELNKSIYDKLCNIVEEYNENIKSRIEVINKGISDKEETINYISTEGSSHIGSEGAEIGYLSTLDKCIADEMPTLIKMDIEGAELSALKGGSEIIKKFKPDLAICIYHKFQDVWEIPEYIKSLVPEYKIYFRHHSKTLIETVCYATIR
jgi:FkbM family methyltransferase